MKKVTFIAFLGIIAAVIPSRLVQADQRHIGAEFFGVAAIFEEGAGPAVGGALLIFLPTEQERARFSIRPEFAFHDIGGANDYFITGNLQTDLLVADGLAALSLHIGGGVNIFEGPNLGGPLASASAQMLHDLISGPGKYVADASGGVFQGGLQVKIFLGDYFYIYPGLTYVRGFGDVTANNIRLNVGLGAEF